MADLNPAAPVSGGGSDDFLDLVTRIFSRFVDLSPAAVIGEIQSSLQRLLEHFQAERCVLFQVDSAGNRATVIAVSQRDSAVPMPETLDARESFPWLFEQVILNQRVVNILSPEDLPASATQDRRSLAELEARTLLLIPLLSGGVVEHVISISSSLGFPTAPVGQVPRLRLLGEIFVGALKRKALEEAQTEASRFERLIADICARFAGVWSDQIDAQINRALFEVLEFAEVDQVGFFNIYPERGEAHLTYLAHVDDIVPARMSIDYASLFPWLYEILVTRSTPYAYSHTSDLPPVAVLDKQNLDAASNLSGLYIPFVVDGAVRYIFGMTCNRYPRTWPDHFWERLRVLGGVFVNALSRKSVFDALKKAEEFTEATLSALHRYVCVIDAEGRIVKQSEGWASIHQASPRAHPGQYFEACVALAGQGADDAARFLRGLRKILQGELDEFAMESLCLLGNRRHWIRSKVTRFEIEQASYAAIFHEDITPRKQSELELEELRSQHWHADRVARTAVLISSLSHELSQPLTAILSNAQAGLRFLNRDLLDKQQFVDILGDIVADNKRAVEVIESLRTILRRQKTERKVVDAAKVVHDVLGLLHSEMLDKNVETVVEAEPDCLVLVDQAQLQQVILNLMLNGIDAMHELARQRLFRIAIWRTMEGEVRLSVQDSGVGIDPAEHDKLFEAFWTTKPKGTGMGLPICRAIIESHQGRIWVEAQRGSGSTFFIALPEAERMLMRDQTA